MDASAAGKVISQFWLKPTAAAPRKHTLLVNIRALKMSAAQKRLLLKNPRGLDKTLCQNLTIRPTWIFLVVTTLH